MARERAVFGHLLHWFPTPAEYEALTQVELDAMRRVCAELTAPRK